MSTAAGTARPQSLDWGHERAEAQATEHGAAYPRHPARPADPPERGPLRPGGRGAAGRADPPRHAGPGGDLPAVGPAPAPPDAAGDGRLRAQPDLAPARLGQRGG